MSLKNVVIMTCSQVTKDCQEKPDSRKKRQGRKKNEREGLISYLRK
jgi:hypothetical protein